ncbi:hypothetical protein MRX96_032861 [Rhipicephalus microplus]
MGRVFALSSPPGTSHNSKDASPTTPSPTSKPSIDMTMTTAAAFYSESPDNLVTSVDRLERGILGTAGVSLSEPSLPPSVAITLKTASGGSVLDIDAFGLMVALCLSAPSLFANAAPLPLGGCPGWSRAAASPCPSSSPGDPYG